MDWEDSAAQSSFREDVANFIRERLPAYYAERGESVETAIAGPLTWYTDRASEDEEVRDAAKDWADALAERGWIAPHWPKEYGGGGLSQVELVIFREEMSKASAPGVGGSGVSLLGPTLLLHGSEEQRRKYLGDILSGEVAWAQGYSEPGAGSDLASLSTRAQRDGDEYVVNGQKIWTSGAHDADALFALVRTDPEAPKHRGISFLLIDDIHASGITIRPLIDATWSHHINEVFFDSVRVPVSNLLGEENRGWYVAMTLLDHERSGIGSAAALLSEITALIGEVAEDERSQLARNPVLRSRLADLVIGAAITHNLALRVASMQAAGLVPNYEASMTKLFHSEQSQELHRVALRAFGLHAQIWPGDGREVLGGRHVFLYIRTIPATIAGGSSEVQRNIIATRGLGLPRG